MSLATRNLRPTALDRDQPLRWRSPVPESIDILGVRADAATKFYDMHSITITIPGDSDWRGVWIEEGKPAQPIEAELYRTTDAFLRAVVREQGTYTLRLRYEGRAAKAGLIASVVAWAIWALLWFTSARRRD